MLPSVLALSAAYVFMAALLLVMALKALSQRAVVALLQLFTLITVGSAFFLWLSTPDPNVHQIVSLSIYGSLVLAINWLVYFRRK